MEGEQLAKVTIPTVGEIEDDPRIALEKFKNNLENFKLKMQAFGGCLEYMQNSKMNERKKTEFVKDAKSKMDDMAKEMCELINRDVSDIQHKMELFWNELQENIVLNE
ncbi:uncharacterized protein LOC126884522 [Diabrotica virgifera virgifera]|uniref:Biogenesis of lysosome-related organelles complex 1 subunit 5 n=1 Tax=Diabrotica virgifera virgifera TaxID=50390 RepID=A0ABM5K8A6_DIAVI|nr:uncharacterized protein LOC126884522 [Diabrotica virgifera virgifera]